MSIANSLKEFLNGRGVSYEIVEHDRTASALQTASVCKIPKANLAKGVLLRRKHGYVLAILPASCRVELSKIGNWLNEPVGLANEKDVQAVFSDCDRGSIPPVPAAYGLRSVMDDSLKGLQEIYFEGGDHRSLVHVRGREFHKLLYDVPHAPIGGLHH